MSMEDYEPVTHIECDGSSGSLDEDDLDAEDLSVLPCVNSQGTYFCPYCPGRKKKNYKLNELLQHLKGVSESPKANITTRKRHEASFLSLQSENSAQLRSESIPSQHLPQKLEEREFAWPWKCIIVNLQTKPNSEGFFEGPTRDALRQRFVKFNVRDAKVFHGFLGHEGVGVVEFHDSMEGWEHAQAFWQSFDAENHGFQGWSTGNHDLEMYAWLVTKEDMNRPAGQLIGSWKWPNCLSQYFKKKKWAKSVSKAMADERVERESLKAREAEFRKSLLRDKRAAEDRIDFLSMCTKALHEELAESKRRVKQSEDSLVSTRLLHELELQNVRKQHEDKILNLKLQNRVNNVDPGHGDLIDGGVNIDDIRLNNLESKHRKEQETLEQIFHSRRLKLEDQQFLEKFCQQKSLIHESEKQEHMDVAKLLDEIKECKEDAGFWQDMNSDLAYQNQKLTFEQSDAFSAAKTVFAGKRFSKFLEKFPERAGHICLKVTGTLNSAIWLSASQKRYFNSDEDWEMKAIEWESNWQTRVNDSNFMPFKTLIQGGKPVRVEDEFNSEMNFLRMELGDEVCADVMRAVFEREEFNSSGGYQVQILWNNESNRQASLKDVIRCMSRYEAHLSDTCKKLKSGQRKRSRAT